jgi:hypothetical protein
LACLPGFYFLDSARGFFFLLMPVRVFVISIVGDSSQRKVSFNVACMVKSNFEGCSDFWLVNQALNFLAIDPDRL